LGGDLVTQIGDNTGKLVTCYGKMQDTAGEIGGDAGQAMGDYIAAGALLVDGGQILTNIATQGAAGVTAAKVKADAEWKAVSADQSSLYRDVWGTSPGAPLDLAKAIQNLGGLAVDTARRNRLLSDLGDAASRLLGLGGKALDAAKNAFLNLNTLKPNARSKFDQAAEKAHSSLARFQAQKAAPKGRHVVIPRLPSSQLLVLKAGGPATNLGKVRLTLPVK
ncbi:MAG TPA: hypothetical protein VMN04_11190, partial [Thermoanaerobaculia bacterium]|nr:hypothetical protein [Thermoanaerobaculia bacterium]